MARHGYRDGEGEKLAIELDRPSSLQKAVDNGGNISRRPRYSFADPVWGGAVGTCLEYGPFKSPKHRVRNRSDGARIDEV